MNQKERMRREQEDVATVMSSQAGRRFVARLLLARNVCPVKSDPVMTYFQLGVQENARLLEQMLINNHLEVYKLMLSEQHADEEDTSCNVSATV